MSSPAMQSATTPVPLTVEVGAPTGVQVHPDLWGIFLEDINNALDGGLNAELVRNGDFEFNHADHPGWGPLTAWRHAGVGNVEVRSEDPVHPNNLTYVRLVGPLELTNEGFDPIEVTPGARWRLSLFTWKVSGTGEVSCGVVSSGGEMLAQAVLPVAEGGWHHLEVELEGERAGRGELVIRVPEGLTLEVDVVSLLPLGANGAPLTFRPDLLQALRELAPSFVRFPGGCLAHGLGLANMYHWKETVGPRHERRQTFNTWGYHQSRQIGYLEYFQLCEELGAAPMPIVAAGVCCQNLRGRARAIPMEEMPAFVQDVLDLVEFARGGTDTVWGARRAELGHPEPFGLRYLGVGNEDEITDDFRARYRLIADAVAEAHPEVTVIGTAGPQPFGRDFDEGWEYARAENVAIVDEHAYRTPRWFHQNLDRYDSYPRGGGEVYFGEYAARTNRVRSALAEAAFMIAMEHNGDVVRLASYAPLLARIGHTQWEPDLIYFDAERVLPSASYYVQQLFSQVRGRFVHEVALSGAEPVQIGPWPGGPVRLASPGATVTIEEVVLDGVAHPGARLSSSGEEVVLGSVGETFELELLALRTSGTEGLTVRLGSDADALELALGGWQNKVTAVNAFADGISNDIDGPTAWPGVRTGVPVRVRAVLGDGRLRIWVDGELRHDLVPDRRPEQRVVVGVLSRGGASVAPDGEEGRAEGAAHVVRLVNATGTERAAQVRFAEGSGIAGAVTARVTALAGAGPDDGAAFEPSPVSPRVSEARGDGGFGVVLPPWSLVVAEVSSAR